MAVDENPDDVRMSLGDHLEDLRKRLLLGLTGPVIIAGVALLFGRHLLMWLTRPLLVALKSSHLPPQLLNTDAVSPFTLYMKVSLATGLILGFPWLLYQLWRFVAPGLYRHERTLVRRLIPGSFLMSVIGVFFMYYVMLPMMLFFLINFTLALPMPDLEPTWFERVLFQQPDRAGVREPELSAVAPARIPVLQTDPLEPYNGDTWVKLPERELRVFVDGQVYSRSLTVSSAVAPWFEIGQYIGLVAMLGMAVAVAFQLPLVMLALGWMGIVEAGTYVKVRKYAFFGTVVLGAVLTPTGDPLSLALMSLPLYGLYELGIALVRWTTRGRREGKGLEA